MKPAKVLSMPRDKLPPSMKTFIIQLERYERALKEVREVTAKLPHKAGMHLHGVDQGHRCPRCRITQILDEALGPPVT